MRHVVGVQPVEGRLVQAVQRRLQVLDEVPLRQHHLVVLGPDGGGDPPRDGPLVELLLLEGQGEGVDGALGGALGQVGHDRRVHAAGEEDRQGHVAGEVEPQPLLQDGGQAVLVHGRIGGAVGDAPEVLLADLLAGAVELEQPARPEQIDALDGGTGADHEAVPHAAGHGLRVEARRAQQPGGQQGTKLRGEGHRPARVRIRRPCQVEGLDAQRIPGQQEPALLRVPAGEGEHAAQPAHRARPVQAERAQHDGRVAGGLELLPLGHQAPPQVAEVVDLAVEDHHVPGHRVHHGLGTGGREVEDGEPAMGQQRAPAAGVRRGDPRPAGVRAAVDHGVAHPLQRGAVGLVQSSDDPGNATHRLGPSRFGGFGNGPDQLVHRFLGTDHLRRIHVIHDGLYPGF